MRKRWSISLDQTAWTTVTPLNGSKVRLQDARNLDEGQVFFRRKLSADLVFGGDDYAFFLPYERGSTTRCVKHYIRVENLCGGVWREFWRGRFSTGSGEWDRTGCLFSVRPDPVDAYTCLLEKAKVKRNILQVDVVDGAAAVVPSIEWTACLFHAGLGGSGTSICNPNSGFPDTTAIGTEWWFATFITTGYYAPVGIPLPDLFVYWRESIVTECVGGNPVPPPGTGWTLLDNNCATDGTAKYIREPLIPFTFDVQEGTCSGGVAIPPAISCTSQWTELIPCGMSLDSITYPPYFVCYSPEPVALPRSRTLRSAIEYLIAQTDCDLAGIRSDFFEWDPPGDAPGYVTGQNYVTGAQNQVDQLLILQKTDVILPAATNPATIGEMTFLEAMTALRVMFRVFYDIDADGYLRLEHYSYWYRTVGTDITIMLRVNEPMRYKHLAESIPSIERAKFMEAQGRDFVGRDIQYDSICAKAEEVKEWSPGRITTDVAFVLTDPTSISKDGFVIIATRLSGGVYTAIIDTGAITGNLIGNAPMSWANLQRDFWTWDRYLPTANMNAQDVVFDGFLPNIEQEDVRIPLCCETMDMDPRQLVASRLGDLLDRDAVVEQADHDLFTDRTTLTLRYAY